jgi:hypothetical protein
VFEKNVHHRISFICAIRGSINVLGVAFYVLRYAVKVSCKFRYSCSKIMSTIASAVICAIRGFINSLDSPDSRFLNFCVFSAFCVRYCSPRLTQNVTRKTLHVYTAFCVRKILTFGTNTNAATHSPSSLGKGWVRLWKGWVRLQFLPLRSHFLPLSPASDQNISQMRFF